VLPQYYFGFVTSFSGQKLYHDVLYQFFNLFYTAIPVFVLGIVDQDVSRGMSLRFPELYEIGTKQIYFNNRVFLAWVTSGVWHSLMVFLLPFFTFSNGAITHPDGKAGDLWLLGSVVFLLVCLVTNLKIMSETYYLTWLTWLAVLGSIAMWVITQAWLSGSGTMVNSSELQGTLARLLGMPTFYACVFLTCIAAMVRDVHWKALERTLYPSMVHVVQDEMLKQKRAAKAAR